MELLSLTSDNDLVLAKLDDYYLCLVEPSKRKYGLNWYEAKDYYKSLGKDYSLPSMDELNLIHTNKEDFSLVEACLYSDEVNTLDFISTDPNVTGFVWSSSEMNIDNAWSQSFNSGFKYNFNKHGIHYWVLPVRRVST